MLFDFLLYKNNRPEKKTMTKTMVFLPKQRKTLCTNSPLLFSEKRAAYHRNSLESVVDINYAHLTVESNFPTVGEFYFIFIALTFNLDDGSIRVVGLHIRTDGSRDNL